MVEMPIWINYLMWILGFIVVLAVLVLFNNWSLNKKVIDKKTGRKKMLVDFRGADGFMPRKLVSVDPTGKSVTINGGKYFLSEVKKWGSEEADSNEASLRQELAGGVDDKRKLEIEAQLQAIEGERKVKAFPILRFAKYPAHPFLGLGKQETLRLEEYQEGNPEPIHPFYGKWVNSDGEACDPDEPGAVFKSGRLVATASEIVGRINEEQLMEATAETEEIQAMQKAWQKLVNNMPGKNMLYLLCGGGILLTGITLVVLWGLKGAMGY